MKFVKIVFSLALSSLGVLGGAQAQNTITNLHNFSMLVHNSNGDGANPFSTLILSGSNLYGTTIIGGPGTSGTVFAFGLSNGALVNLHNFTGAGDGSRPYGAVTLSGGVLYGTAKQGGAAQNGTIFSVNPDGSGFNVLYSFKPSVFNPGNFLSTNADGANPLGSLVVSGNTIYGTANTAGAFGYGTIFALTIAGNSTNFTTLYSFSNSPGVNADGNGPYGALALSGGMLYGTAYEGGAGSQGAIFRININGTGFTNLHSFGVLAADGETPEGGLTVDGTNLYGTTLFGGVFGNGTVFSINGDGSSYTNLYNFTAVNNGANADGYQSRSPLVVSNGNLYGTASGGGLSGDGTVYSLSTNGGNFATVYNLTNTTTGANPYGGVAISGNILYGVAAEGGAADNGTIFAVTVKSQGPSLAIKLLPSSQVVVSWSAMATNFGLQMSPTLLPKNWSNVTTGIFTAGTNFVFTNPVSSVSQFFRLRSQ